MLHRIEQACMQEFNWVRELQRELLNAACTETDPDQITVAWAQRLRPDIGERWLGSLVYRKDKMSGIRKTLLEHLQTIAAADASLKTQLRTNCENNDDFSEAFADPHPTAHPLQAVSSLGEDALQKAVRGFFQTFYDPEFYKDKGFPVPGLVGAKFTRDLFISRFKEANPDLDVCPFCDESLGDPDVDHFYAKKHYPDLATHPANLVPICKTCNGRNRKGEKAPLTNGEADPMLEWFHPYLRSAQGQYTVQFEEREGKVWPILSGQDPLNQTRLENLDALIGLSERWHSSLKHVLRSTAKKLKQLRQSDRARFREKLAEWAESETYELSGNPRSILKQGCYRCAADGQMLLLDEIRVEMEGLDPVTMV